MRALPPRCSIGWAALLLLLVCWTSTALAAEPYSHTHPGIPHGCPNPPQCGWLAPEFGPCTSCAAVTRDVSCHCNGLNVVESYCEAGTRPSPSSPCSNSPACVPGSGELNSTCAWSAGPWAACSSKCKHKRSVTCLCEGKVKSDKNCKEAGPEPDDSGVCYRTDPVPGNQCTKPEPGENNPPGACRWVAEAWGACDAKCTHSRKVTCQCDDTVGECAEHRCSGAGTPPPKKEPCAYNATEPDNLCPPGSGGLEVCAWVVSSPGACDSKCLRSRSVKCVCDGKRSSDASCAAAGPEPPKKVPCVYDAAEPNNKCPPSSGGLEVCAWKVGNFGSCSSKCVRSRSVKCECDGKRETDTTKCAGPEPYKSEPCFYDPSDPSCKCRAPPTSCHWEYGQYGPCTADDLSQCGPGHKTRTARCVDSQGRTVADANCPGSPVDLCVACEDRRQCTCAWVYDEWSACDAHCRRSRVAHCRCGPFPSPDSACGPCADLTESCDWDGDDPSCRCPKPPQPLCRWVYPRRWGPCSRECGLDGVQTREPVCRRVGLLQSAAELAAEAAGRPSCNCGPKPPPKVQRCNVCPCRPRCTWQFRGDNYGQCRPKLFPTNDAAAEQALVGPPEDSEWCGWGVQFRSAQCFVAPSNYDEDIAFAVVAHAPQPCDDCRPQDKPRDWHDPKPRLCQKDCPAEDVECGIEAVPGSCSATCAGAPTATGSITAPFVCVKPAGDDCVCPTLPDPVVQPCTIDCPAKCEWVPTSDPGTCVADTAGSLCGPGKIQNKCVHQAGSSAPAGSECNSCSDGGALGPACSLGDCEPACHWIVNPHAPCLLPNGPASLSRPPHPRPPQCPGQRERKCVVDTSTERGGGGHNYEECDRCDPEAEERFDDCLTDCPAEDVECATSAGPTGECTATCAGAPTATGSITTPFVCLKPDGDNCICPSPLPDPVVESCTIDCPAKCEWVPTSDPGTCVADTAGSLCGPGKIQNKCVHQAGSSAPAGSECNSCSDGGALGPACSLGDCPPPNSVSCPATACTDGSSGTAQVVVTPSQAGDPDKSVRISVSFGGPPAGLLGDITGFFIDGLPWSLVPSACSLTEIPGPPDYLMSATTRQDTQVDGHSNANVGGCSLNPDNSGWPRRPRWDLGVAFGTGGSNAEGGDFQSVEFRLECPLAIALSLSPSDLASARVLVRVQSVGPAGSRGGSSHLACLFTPPNPV